MNNKIMLLLIPVSMYNYNSGADTRMNINNIKEEKKTTSWMNFCCNDDNDSESNR